MDQKLGITDNYYVPFIIEPSGKGERGYDIWSRLLKDRIVFLNGPVYDAVSGIICAQFLYLEAMSSEPIDFYINSPGGYVTSGMAIYDTMRYLKSPIRTLIIGQACSMGSLLATAGDKGQRRALPNARTMIHQPSGGAYGQATDVSIHAAEILKTKQKLNEIYAFHTGQPLEVIEAAMERDRFFSAEEAKEFGLLDEVVLSAKV